MLSPHLTRDKNNPGTAHTQRVARPLGAVEFLLALLFGTIAFYIGAFLLRPTPDLLETAVLQQDLLALARESGRIAVPLLAGTVVTLAIIITLQRRHARQAANEL